MEKNSLILPSPQGMQARALELMLQGRKDAHIARELGISRMTLYRWRRYDIVFIQALEERQSMLRDHINTELLEMGEIALGALRRSLTRADPRTQLQAARLVLTLLKQDKDQGQSGIIDLLGEAIKGIEGDLGITDGRY